MYIFRDSVLAVELLYLQLVEGEAAVIKYFSIVFFPSKILPCFSSFSFTKTQLTGSTVQA